MDLSSLIHPVDPETFRQDYWERQPLRIHRDDPNYYRSLLSLTDVDGILSLASIRSSQIRILREGKETPLGKNGTSGLIGTSGQLEEVYEAYRAGATVVLQFLHESWAPLWHLCQSLAAEFSAAVQVNVYLTPAQERGFNVHYDSHDVFVLQSEGVKHWSLYESPIRLPLKGQPYDAKTMAPGALLDQFDLKPGDLLYIPRGCLHAAESRDSASLHLTVGVNTVTWAAVVLRAIERIIEQDSCFRVSLPLGFARDRRLQEQAEVRLAELVAVLGERIEPVPAVQEAVEEAWLGRPPVLDGHLLDLEGMTAVGLATRVRRRPTVQWRLVAGEAGTALHFHGKAVDLPTQACAGLVFITEADEFSASDLPGDLNDAGKLMLVRTLLREGFLTICREPLAP
jgi:ribosomal protein L16 Arg81 hydroxylase